MVFAFLHPYTYFEYLREDLREQFAEAYADEAKHAELYFKLTDEVLKEEQNFLWITYGGPPFGYVSLCFDMAYEKHGEDEEEHPFYKRKV
ncbi:hypothetical protein GCM10010465_08890 [Actinomadura fibrosa]